MLITTSPGSPHCVPRAALSQFQKGNDISIPGLFQIFPHLILWYILPLWVKTFWLPIFVKHDVSSSLRNKKTRQLHTSLSMCALWYTVVSHWWSLKERHQWLLPGMCAIYPVTHGLKPAAKPVRPLMTLHTVVAAMSPKLLGDWFYLTELWQLNSLNSYRSDHTKRGLPSHN